MDVPIIDLEMESEDPDDVIDIDVSPEKAAEMRKESGNQLYKQKRYRKALPFYSEAIQLCPQTASYYGNRAACYIMLAQYKDALADARKSIEIDPAFVKGYLRVAKCSLMLGDLVAADKALHRVKELDPENAQLTHEQATLLSIQKLKDDVSKCLEKKDPRKAIYLIDRILDVLVGCNHFKALKAECFAQLGRYEEAQDFATDILHFDSQNADAHYIRGLCLYHQGNIEKAISHFQFVLRVAPDHQKALECYKRARSLKNTKEEGNEAFNAGNLQKAYDLYSKALLIDPQNSPVNAKLYFNRATVSSKMNNLKQAVADCTAALKLNETYVKALLRRAKCYQDLGQLEEAERDYEKVCKLDKSRESKRLLHEAKMALKRSKRKDYYKILGIERNASEEDIKRAYKKRALDHHPDRHSNASEDKKSEQEKLFKEVGEAYAVLSDPKKRSRYDSGQDLEEMEGMGSGWPGNFDGCGRFPGFFAGPNTFNLGDGFGSYSFHFA